VADMIAAGEAWFEEKRRAHASVEAQYHPELEPGVSYPCQVTLVVGKWDVIDASQQIVRIESKDFFVSTADYPAAPQSGDQITYREHDVEQVYEVTVPRGREQCWGWANRAETLRRVHTFHRADPPSSLLARAIGVHTTVSITDDEIRSDLSIDTSSSRRLSKAVSPIGQYIYIVLPDSFGAPIITTNGLLTTAWEKTTRSITFDGQLARSYSIYRSTYPVAGTVIVGVS
jgi:hypothetical protein